MYIFNVPFDSSSSRKRLSDLRERERESVSETIQGSRTTILINMFIQIAAGLIYAVGLYVIIQFLNLRKTLMNPLQYKIYFGAFTAISCGWYIYLFIKIRSYYKRFRNASTRDQL